MAEVRKGSDKAVMIADVYGASSSRYVYFTDTKGDRIYINVYDIPQIVNKLNKIYSEARKYGKA